MTTTDSAGQGRHGTTKRSYKDRSKRALHDEAAIERLLGQLSDANRDWITAVVQRRRNQRIRPSSIRIQLHVWKQVDDLLGGIHFKDATLADVRIVIEAMQQGKADSTVKGYSVHLKAAWKEVLDVERLPRSWNQELTVHTRRTSFQGHIISPDDLRALLEVASRRHNIHDRLMTTALVWTLWDSGFRASELLSLNLSDLEFDQHGVRLTLRPEAPDLKTGPRSIYVVECAAALRAWLALHPMAGSGHAPLWLGRSRLRGSRGQWCSAQISEAQTRMGYIALHDLVRDLSLDAGLDPKLTREHLRPHDFRHSRATRSDWRESKMRLFFGWSPGSDMPSKYTHLRDEDMVEQILRDAGINERGVPVTKMHDPGVKTCPMCAEDIKAAAMKCKHCGHLLSTDVTARPAGHRPLP